MNDGNPVPDFIIGGAPRSGTTYLATLLGDVSGIYIPMPLIPEPKVFNDPALGDTDAIFKRYETLFIDCPKGAMKGEKTSGYLESEDCARRIAACLPSVKLIFIFRHPVDRAFSNYLWTKKNGHEQEDFEAVWHLSSDDRPNPLAGSHPHIRLYDYLERSRYGKQLSTYLEYFPRESIHCILFESLILNLQDEWAGLGHFLGRQLDPPASERWQPVNSTKGVEGDCPTDLKLQIMNTLRSDLDLLYTMIPSARSYWEDD